MVSVTTTKGLSLIKMFSLKLFFILLTHVFHYQEEVICHLKPSGVILTFSHIETFITYYLPLHLNLTKLNFEGAKIE